MPDLDIIDRNVPRGWRPPLKLFVGVAKPDEVARAVSKALARSLRENGGLPGFDRWVALLDERIAGVLDPHSAFVRAEAIERELGQGRHVKVAARSVQSILAELGHSRTPALSLGRPLAEEFLRRLAQHDFFGRIRPGIVGRRRFKRIADVDERERACRQAMEPFLQRLASGLVRDPEGEELRSPSVRGTRSPTTKDLLHRSIM